MKLKHKSIHKTLLLSVDELFKKVHIDLIGKMSKSINGYEYVLLISDNCTRKRWIVLLKHKSETYKRFEAWVDMIKAKTALKISTIQCNQGEEFDSEKFRI